VESLAAAAMPVPAREAQPAEGAAGNFRASRAWKGNGVRAMSVRSSLLILREFSY